MYMHICVCIYVYTYIFIYIYPYVCICIYYVYMYICICVYTYVCIFYVYICTYMILYHALMPNRRSSHVYLYSSPCIMMCALIYYHVHICSHSYVSIYVSMYLPSTLFSDVYMYTRACSTHLYLCECVCIFSLVCVRVVGDIGIHVHFCSYEYVSVYMRCVVRLR